MIRTGSSLNVQVASERVRSVVTICTPALSIETGSNGTGWAQALRSKTSAAKEPLGQRPGVGILFFNDVWA